MQSNHFYSVLLAAIFLILSSCAAEIKLKTPTANFISPEAMGGFGNFELASGAAQVPTVEMTDDAKNRAPDVNNPRVIENYRAFLQGGLGLLSFADIYYDPGTFITTKVQVLGDHANEAKKGNISAALFGGFAWKDETGRGTGIAVFNSKRISVAPEIRYSLKSTQWKGGALLGFRLRDNLNFYTGASYELHRYSGGFDNVSGRDGRFAGEANSRSILAGLEYSAGRRFVLRAEDAYTVTKIPAVMGKKSGHYAGLLLALRFL
jgi:hypothetical protein